MATIEHTTDFLADDDLTAQFDKLTTLMDDLTAVADEGDLPAEPAVAVDLGELARAAVDRVRRRAFDVGIELELDEPAVVSGRWAALERALVNVLDNACKWSPRSARVRGPPRSTPHVSRGECARSMRAR